MYDDDENKLAYFCEVLGTHRDHYYKLTELLKRSVPDLVSRDLTDFITYLVGDRNMTWDDALLSLGVVESDDEWGFAPSTQ